MISGFFHRWEQRLADAARNQRVVRPFDWGLDWMPPNGKPHDGVPLDVVRAWVDSIMEDTDAFFTPEPTSEYVFTPSDPARVERLDVGAPVKRFTPAKGEAGVLTFPSALATPHPENNIVRGRFFPAKDKRRAVVLMPQWNSDAGGHIGLAQLLARLGINALRISKPYHDVRMPPELTRADYIVSSNVVRTLQVCRQAVLDTRRALWWLRDQG